MNYTWTKDGWSENEKVLALPSDKHWLIEDLLRQADDWWMAATDPRVSIEHRHEAQDIYFWMLKRIERLVG